MASEQRPGYLRPVPSGPEATAREPEKSASETPGLTPPLGRGGTSKFLTDVIVDLGYATRERVDEVIDEARTAGRPADELLIDRRLVNPDQLSRALAERYGLAHIDLNLFHVDMGAANLLSVAAARRYLAVPVGYVDPQTLLVAVADPANVFAVDDIQLITGLSCKVAVAAADDIEALIRRLNTLESAVTEAVESFCAVRKPRQPDRARAATVAKPALSPSASTQSATAVKPR